MLDLSFHPSCKELFTLTTFEVFPNPKRICPCQFRCKLGFDVFGRGLDMRIILHMCEAPLDSMALIHLPVSCTTRANRKPFSCIRTDHSMFSRDNFQFSSNTRLGEANATGGPILVTDCFTASRNLMIKPQQLSTSEREVSFSATPVTLIIEK